MPRIAWTTLPKSVQEHLLDRVRVRAIDAEGSDRSTGLDHDQPRSAGWPVVQGFWHVQARRSRADTKHVSGEKSAVLRGEDLATPPALWVRRHGQVSGHGRR